MRDRIAARWPWLAYYGGLLRDLPSLLFRASDAVGRLVGVVSLVLLVVGGVGAVALDEWRWQLATVAGAAALVGIGKANWDRVHQRETEVQRLQGELDAMKAKDHEETMKTMRGHLRRYAHDAIIAAVDKAKSDLLEPLWADEEPSEDRWTALVDKWDADNSNMLREWWKDSDVDYYRLDSGLVTSVGDWRDKLAAFVRAKSMRLLEIAQRKSKYADD